jgi:transcriptional regulator with XRE-family HTH domain
MLQTPQNLRLIRVLSEKTQDEFSRKFGISVAMLKSYEGGKAKPDHLLLSRISKAFNISIDDLKNKELTEEDIVPMEDKVEKVETKSTPERVLLEESIHNLTETQKINAISIDKMVNLLVSVFNSGQPLKVVPTISQEDISKDTQPVQEDLALGKRYKQNQTRDKIQKDGK